MDSPLLDRLRKEREEDERRRANTKDVGSLQEEFRSFDSQDLNNSRESRSDDRQSGEGARGDERDQEAPGTATVINGSADNPAIEGSSSADSTESDDHRPVQPRAVKKKPQGLKMKPSARASEELRAYNREAQQKSRAKKKAASTIPNAENFSPEVKAEKPERVLKGKRSAPLTEKEAANLKPGLIDALSFYFVQLDELIRLTSKGHQPVSIWSDMDEEETGTLADWFLARGQRSARAAQGVQNMLDSHLNIMTSLISLPRFIKTFQHYMVTGFSLK